MGSTRVQEAGLRGEELQKDWKQEAGSRKQELQGGRRQGSGFRNGT
jgi:hypothetical protein